MRLDPSTLAIGQLVMVDGIKYRVARKDHGTPTVDGAGTPQVNTYLVRVNGADTSHQHDTNTSTNGQRTVKKN
jgi:hypothetical protein